MTIASVYSTRSHANALRREALIHAGVEDALNAMADIERRPLTETMDAEARRSPPGMATLRPAERVIALGRAAHTVLADFQKRSLFAVDLELESTRASDFDETIERFVWSCVNTLKVVAIGEGAWRSVQMLPTADCSYYDVPPLRMAISPAARPASPTRKPLDRVLVINHDARDRRAEDIAGLLRRHDLSVATTGFATDIDSDGETEACWSVEADIHVHVGHHTVGARQPRIIDSWQSRTLAFQVLGPFVGRAPSDALLVEDEVNGFLCPTGEKIVEILGDLRNDRVMQRKVVEAGFRTAAPLAKTWTRIAEVLLA